MKFPYCKKKWSDFFGGLNLFKLISMRYKLLFGLYWVLKERVIEMKLALYVSEEVGSESEKVGELSKFTIRKRNTEN